MTTNYAEAYEAMTFKEWSNHFRCGDHIIDRSELQDYTDEAESNDLKVHIPDYDQPRDSQKVRVLVFRQLESETEDRVHGRG